MRQRQTQENDNIKRDINIYDVLINEMTQKRLKLARIYCFSLHYVEQLHTMYLLQSFAGGDDDRQLLPMSNSIIEFEVADKEWCSCRF